MQKTIETGRENSILRTVSPAVTLAEKAQAMKLARELADWVRSNDNAVGLAAPQAGVNLRVIGCALWVETPDGYDIRKVVGMINPVITEASDELCSEEEACFSVPGETWVVRRPRWIVLTYLDEQYRSQKIRLEWFAARVVMHEIDHLDGVLFVDKLEGEV
jgi:peptide deformylase